MKILLTGYKGLIGKEIYRQIQSDYVVHVFDSGTDWETWVSDFECLKSEITDIDLIIHCGAISNSERTDNNVWDLNYEASLQIAKYARQLKSKVMFFSSAAAIKPDTMYGWSKKTAEKSFVRVIPKDLLCILRPFNVWDWYEQNKQNPSIVYKIIHRQLPYVYNDCERDFVHLSDVVEAVKLVIEDWRHGVFQIGTGIPILLTSLIDAIYKDLTLTPPPRKECVINKRLVADNDLILPDWTPNQSSVMDSIEDIVSFMNQEYCDE